MTSVVELDRCRAVDGVRRADRRHRLGRLCPAVLPLTLQPLARGLRAKTRALVLRILASCWAVAVIQLCAEVKSHASKRTNKEREEQKEQKEH